MTQRFVLKSRSDPGFCTNRKLPHHDSLHCSTCTAGSTRSNCTQTHSTFYFYFIFKVSGPSLQSKKEKLQVDTRKELVLFFLFDSEFFRKIWIVTLFLFGPFNQHSYSVLLQYSEVFSTFTPVTAWVTASHLYSCKNNFIAMLLSPLLDKRWSGKVLVLALFSPGSDPV